MARQMGNQALKAWEEKMDDGHQKEHKHLRNNVRHLAEKIDRLTKNLQNGEAPEQTAPQDAGGRGG